MQFYNQTFDSKLSGITTGRKNLEKLQTNEKRLEKSKKHILYEWMDAQMLNKHNNSFSTDMAYNILVLIA